MGFLDLFKPKWKHSDADVRAEAVKQLTPEDHALLAQVVRKDSDPRVRRIALKKIDDPQLLGELAESDPDEGLRRDAGEKASSLRLSTAIGEGDENASLQALERISTPKAVAEVAKRAAHESVRRAALARLSDPKAIAEVARKSDDPHIRRQAVERVTEVGVLREIAISDGVKEVAMVAIQRLDDPAALEAVIKKTKSKAIKNAAKAKLTAQKEAAAPKRGLSEAKRKSRLALICRTVEEAAASDDWSHAAQSIDVAEASLAELGSEPGDDPFLKRFQRAVQRFKLRREEQHAREKARIQMDLRKAQAAEAESRRTVVETAQRAEQTEEDAKLKEIAEAARREENDKRSAERARRAEEKTRRDAEMVEERARKDADAGEELRRLEEVTARLESLVATDDKKAADAALKSAQDVVRSGGPLPREKAQAAKDRYNAAREKLVIRAQELRDTDDWKRWANVPRLEALCNKMDALLGGIHATSDLKAASTEMRALQAEWKTVGAAPKEKSELLWKRFKAAADQVYELCNATLEEERSGNLKKKEELCVRVETLAAAPDDQINWKDTAETVKGLQEEWKGIGHVPKDQSDAIWKRFREACDKFFDRRKAFFATVDEERGTNLKKQEELIAEAESLSGSTDWKETAERLKSLQAAWKESGPAPRDAGEATWKRFREACDKFFDRRKLHFDQLDEERGGNLKKKELLCEKVEALASAEDHELALGEVRKLQGEWKTIGPAPKDSSDAVWNRFRTACDLIYDRTRKSEEEDLPLPPLPETPHTPFTFGTIGAKLPVAGLAEKPAVVAETKPPAVEVKPPVAQPQLPVALPKPPVALPKPPVAGSPTPLSGIAQQLASVASEWEDIATSTDESPLEKKPDSEK